MELALGIPVSGMSSPVSRRGASTAADAISQVATSTSLKFNEEVRQALVESIPILASVLQQLSVAGSIANLKSRPKRQPLVTTYVMLFISARKLV